MTRRAFSLLEVLVATALIAVLVSLLLPMLSFARDAARTTQCASNLRQVGIAWQLYINTFDRFPGGGAAPEWLYGGAEFVGPGRNPVLAASRPVNRFVSDSGANGGAAVRIFECPADAGINEIASGSGQVTPVLPLGRSCFETYGTSYQANRYLLDGSLLGSSDRPLRVAEVVAPPSRLLLLGDAQWKLALEPKDGGTRMDASWHQRPSAGNAVFYDGSLRFLAFRAGMSEVVLRPR